VVLAAVFAHSQVAAVSRTASDRADAVAGLVTAGRLPAVLPTAGDEVAQVIDARGGVVATTSSASRTLPVLPIGELRRLGRREATTVTGGTPFTAGAVRVVVLDALQRGEPVTVVVTEPLAGVQETLRSLRTLLLVAVPVLVAAVAVTCWLLVGSALRPVDALRRGADEVTDLGGGGGGGGDSALPVPAGDDEVAALATTLNRMLARLDAAGRRQRGFVADAAHELRSPLASLRTQLEVAAAVGEPPDGADLLAEVLRLARLVDDLLVLARLDAPPPGRPASEVDLAALAIAAGAPGVTGQGHAVGDPDAIRRVVVNLLDNAGRHATGHVTVEVADGCLTVDDDGPGVPAAQRERVFERFARLDDARARDSGGSGLGLAIARETARASGGDVTVTDAPLGGARFVLTLPVAAARRAREVPEEPA